MSRYIDNIGDFFASNYFDEDFSRKVQQKSGFDNDAIKEMDRNFVQIKDSYYTLKKKFQEDRLRVKDEIKKTHEFHTKLLNALGYDGSKIEYETPYHLNEEEVIPVRQTLYKGDKPLLMILEMQAQIKIGEEEPDGLFEQRYHTEENGVLQEKQQKLQRYHRSQWESVFTIPEGLRLSPTVLNKVISTLFLQEEHQRPAYILLLAANKVYLMEAEKWMRGSYLEFDLELLFDVSAAAKAQNHYATFRLLVGKESLAPDGKQILLEQLDEDSHKSAYEVTKDLKLGIINAVEALANEALYYLKDKQDFQIDEQQSDFAQQVRDDCLTLVYRLLFVFYAESREELSILPVNDSVYQRGYSLEMLRDLEQVPLHSDSARNGFFFHESLTHLFRLMNTGYRERNGDQVDEEKNLDKSFRIRRIDSPLFDDSKLNWLNKVKVRNRVWQNIIQQLSLSREQRGKNRGRISYANLGINQLGSVYESLLSYRGFYTEQDYIEVHPPKDTEETYLVPRSRRDDFKANEVLRDEHEQEVVIPKGRFVYRMSGRDRQKSASYYTPESLTRLTVKYALKHILERIDNNEMKALELLELKLLEPAMGAAAFHNEMINQVAEAYLEYRQAELKTRIAPDKYREELQKVKAYIAANNVYGVDLNPTAIELGKLSLWLNGIHRNMEPPFFANRLACGNAVVGAWFKVWKEKDIRAEKDKWNKPLKKAWWEKAPSMLSFGPNGIKRGKDEIYHFLLPDNAMLSSSGIGLLKEENEKEVKAARKWIKDMLATYSGEEIQKLQRICEAIDTELESYFRFLQRLKKKTGSRYKIFGSEDQAELALHSYEEKEDLAKERLQKNASYFKLKLVMDYWSAFWFWDVREAAELPTREEWLNELIRILDVKPQAPSYRPQTKLFISQGEQLSFDDNMVMDTSNIIKKVDRSSLFEERRLEIVQQLSEQHRFFHPQLEFLDVFRERGGFDIISGNPPWISVSFAEDGVVSERYPEVFVRKWSATKTSKEAAKLVDGDDDLHEMYVTEYLEALGTKTFMGAVQNYPLVSSGRNNLYKAILENCFSLSSVTGFIGLLHPEGVYDDPKGGIFRKDIYSRLKYHFQFINELVLFAEVDHHVKYGANVYSGRKSDVDFISINNLFHPTTVDGSFVHQGHGLCGGYKKAESSAGRMIWNTEPHHDRLVRITEDELRILAKTFEDSDEWQSAKLVSIHSRQILSVLEKLSTFPTKVSSFENKVTDCWNEVTAQKDGIIRRDTKFPDIENYELIYSGPHFFVANPLYKTPRVVCELNSHYDEVDLTQTPEDYVPRTNYVPDEPLKTYANRVKGFPVAWSKKTGKPIQWDRWIDYYKVCFRKMIGSASERTLQPAIIPPKVAHIDGVVTTIFPDVKNTIELACLCSSIVLDFFLKTIGKSNLRGELINTFPLGIKSKLKNQMFVRTFISNCLTDKYFGLWEENWQEYFRTDSWLKQDPRLPNFDRLSSKWEWGHALRTHYERRQALVEIDVLVAMALDLTLEELILIYEVQFPVLQQNEADTWYDTKGNIVFTCSRGLTGVGTDRKTWNEIKDLKQGETYTHTIDPAKNELYGDQQVTYYAPFDKCDRVEDYKVAWEFFEGELGVENDNNH